MKLSLANGDPERAREILDRELQRVKDGQAPASDTARLAAQLGDFDTAGELLMQASQEKDGRWIYPVFIRLPEQATNSDAWDSFWQQPGVAELAELRRGFGFSAVTPGFGDGK